MFTLCMKAQCGKEKAMWICKMTDDVINELNVLQYVLSEVLNNILPLGLEFSGLRTELRTLHTVGKGSVTEPNPQPLLLL